MAEAPEVCEAMVWVADEVIPHARRETVGRIALYFARHGHLNRRAGFAHSARHLLPTAVNMSLRTVYETLDGMVESGLLAEYRDQDHHVYFLNRSWLPVSKREAP